MGGDFLGLSDDICGQQTVASLRTIWDHLKAAASLFCPNWIRFPRWLPCTWESDDAEPVNSSLALRIQQIIATRADSFFFMEIIANLKYSGKHLCSFYHFSFMDFFLNQKVLRYNLHAFEFPDFMAVIQWVLMKVQIRWTTIFTVVVQNTPISKRFPLPFCGQHSI